MIAADIVHIIREQVAGDLAFSEIERDRLAVHTPFMYQDGDHCGFVFARDDSTGDWRITDDGEILMHAEYSGAMTAGRFDRLKKTAEFYGINEVDGELIMNIGSVDNLGTAFFRFSQACLDLVNVAKLPAERKSITPNKFRTKVADVIYDTVPSDLVTRKWHHPELDPNEVYHVDYRVAGIKSDLLVFAARNDKSCLRSAVSCLHYRQKSFPFIGIAIYEDESQLDPAWTVPLNEAVDKWFDSIDRVAEIKEYIKRKSA